MIHYRHLHIYITHDSMVYEMIFHMTPYEILCREIHHGCFLIDLCAGCSAFNRGCSFGNQRHSRRPGKNRPIPFSSGQSCIDISGKSMKICLNLLTCVEIDYPESKMVISSQLAQHWNVLSAWIKLK